MSSFPVPENETQTVFDKLVSTTNLGSFTPSSTGSLGEILAYLAQEIAAAAADAPIRPTRIEQTPTTTAPTTVAALAFGAKSTQGSFTNNLSENPASIAMHPDGTFIALAVTATPFLIVLPWTQSTGTLGTALANGPNHPTVAINAVAWSPDGNWLFALCDTSPRLRVYAFTKTAGGAVGALTDSDALLTGSNKGLAVSPDGTAVACLNTTGTAGNRVRVVPFTTSTGNLGTPVAPGVDPTQNVTGGIAWSPDSAWIGFGMSASPFIEVRSWNGSAIGNKIADPASLPAGNVNDLKWSPDGTVLVTAHTTTPFTTAYPWTGAFGTKLTDPVSLPNSTGQSVAFTPIGKGVVIGHATNPGLTGYPITAAGYGTRFQSANVTDEPIYAVVFDPQARNVLTVGDDDTAIDTFAWSGGAHLAPSASMTDYLAATIEVTTAALQAVLTTAAGTRYGPFYFTVGIHDIPAGIQAIDAEETGGTAGIRAWWYGA